MSEVKDVTEQGGIFEPVAAEAIKKEAEAIIKTEKKPVKKAEKKPSVEKFTFPFRYQFGKDILNEDVLRKQLGFKDRKEYTKAKVKELLSRAVLELQIPDASVEFLPERNTFILSNVLKKKGVGIISASSVVKIQETFFQTWFDFGTEERALVYQNVHTNEEKIIFPNIIKEVGYLEGSPDMFYKNDLDWPLVADLHSHHVLCGTPSKTDNDNEQVRNILFGIAYWKSGGKILWHFRKWDGQGYVPLSCAEVTGIC